MANITDPLIRALQGSDPQNLMEYITRQKIYDSRYWKEECFGLAAVDVLEKAAKIQTIGGLPSKFLCLTLKLLQLQPDPEDIIESFIQQDDFKYVRALGCLYLRLTGRPDDIYNELEPLYRDYRKLRCRSYQNWTLMHMDEFIHELLTETTSVGITLPRLPLRANLQEAGYLEDGPRPTALREVLEDVGGPEAFLKVKALEQNSPAALDLYEKRQGIPPKDKKDTAANSSQDKTTTTMDAPKNADNVNNDDGEKERDDKRKEKKRKKQREEGEMSGDDDNDDKIQKEHKEKPSKKKKKKERNYGSLFKKDSKSKSSQKDDKEVDSATTAQAPPEENSEEYWNEQRAKLGLKALK